MPQTRTKCPRVTVSLVRGYVLVLVAAAAAAAAVSEQPALVTLVAAADPVVKVAVAPQWS